MKRNLREGFTLIETVVTITVLSITAFSAMHIMTEASKTWWNNKTLIELRSEGRYTLEKFASEFKQAETVALNAPTDLTFTADLDADGVAEEIRYQLTGSTLQRREGGAGGTWNVICDNVTALVFTTTIPSAFSDNMVTIDITISGNNQSVHLRRGVMGRRLP